MKKTFKWVGIVVGSLVGLAALFLGTAYVVAEVRLNKEYRVAEEPVVIPRDTLSIERGRHLATAIAKCGDCHGADLAGGVFVDDPAVGRLVAPNLTSGKGGVGAAYTDADWVRAIRHGIRPDGTPMVLMPSNEYWYHSNEELGALIAFVKSLPAIDRELPESSVGPILRVMALLGQMELTPAAGIDHSGVRPPTPRPGPTVAYGKHLVNVGGCIGCHGPGLSGGAIPGAPPEWPASANLTPHPDGLGSWSNEDFVRALRQGIRPDGSIIDARYMPWKATAKMTDDEITALRLYLLTVEPKESGNR